MIRKISAVVLLLACMAGLAVLVTRQQSFGDEKITVATSFYPLFNFSQIVGGKYVAVTNMTPAGAEPHEYEPAARDLLRAQKAKLFVYNGSTFEPWAKKFASSYPGQKVAANYHVALHDTDPHFWLDPIQAQQIVQNIANGLAATDPTHADYYQHNADDYKQKLAQLDVDFRQGLATCKQHEIVSSHDAFGYLGRRYGFAIRGIAGISPDAEPSAERLQELADLVRQKHIDYVFFESLVSPRLADTIATETGAKTLVLDPIEGLSDEEQQRGKDYLSIQRDNLAHLRTALTCQ